MGRWCARRRESGEKGKRRRFHGGGRRAAAAAAAGVAPPLPRKHDNTGNAAVATGATTMHPVVYESLCSYACRVRRVGSLTLHLHREGRIALSVSKEELVEIPVKWCMKKIGIGNAAEPRTNQHQFRAKTPELPFTPELPRCRPVLLPYRAVLGRQFSRSKRQESTSCEEGAPLKVCGVVLLNAPLRMVRVPCSSPQG